MYVCMYVCMYGCMYVYMHVYLYVIIYMSWGPFWVLPCLTAFPLSMNFSGFLFILRGVGCRISQEVVVK